MELMGIEFLELLEVWFLELLGMEFLGSLVAGGARFDDVIMGDSGVVIGTSSKGEMMEGEDACGDEVALPPDVALRKLPPTLGAGFAGVLSLSSPVSTAAAPFRS